MSIQIKNVIPAGHEAEALSMMYGALAVKASGYSLPFLSLTMGQGAIKEFRGKKAQFFAEKERKYTTKDRKITWGELQSIESNSRVSVAAPATASGAVGVVTVQDARPYMIGGTFIPLDGDPLGYGRIEITDVNYNTGQISFKGRAENGGNMAVNPIPINTILLPTSKNIQESDCVDPKFRAIMPTEVWQENYVSALEHIEYCISIEAKTNRGAKWDMKKMLIKKEDERMFLERLANEMWLGKGYYGGVGKSAMHGLDYYVKGNTMSLSNLTVKSMDAYAYQWREINPNASDDIYMIGDRAVMNYLTTTLGHNTDYNEVREVESGKSWIEQYATRTKGFKATNGMKFHFVYDSSLEGISKGGGLGYALDIAGNNNEFVDGQDHGANIALFDYMGFADKRQFELLLTPENTKCLEECKLSITGQTMRVRNLQYRLVL